jgi:hypothetical protein
MQDQTRPEQSLNKEDNQSRATKASVVAEFLNRRGQYRYSFEKGLEFATYGKIRLQRSPVRTSASLDHADFEWFN